jgi:methyl-accepting chemotaxis protein
MKMRNIFGYLGFRKNVGIKRSIAVSFSTLTIAISISTLIVMVYSTRTILNEYFHHEINKGFTAVRQDLISTKAHTKLAADKLTDMHEGFDSAIINNNTSEIEERLKIESDLMKIHGFIIANAEGEVLCSSYKNLDKSQSESFLTYNSALLDAGSIDGYSIMFNLGICQVAGRTIQDSFGETVGSITYISNSFKDTAFVDRVKLLYGVETTIFEGALRVNTTVCDKEGRRVVGSKLDNQEILDVIYKQKKEWVGINNIAGLPHFACYAPLTAYDGNVLGMVFGGLNLQVRTTLTMRLVFSMVICFLVVGSIITILFTRRFGKSIGDPIISLSKQAEYIADGDLTAQDDMDNLTSNVNQVRNLAQSMNKMKTSLRQVIEPIVTFSNMMTAASDQLSNASLELSDGANRQAASLEEISSSMEEMSANIQNNTSNSMETNGMAAEIGQAIGNVDNASAKNLEAARNIAKDIEAINELVMQTNILSLNASVEAARAGDQGKGFGVVAREVGRLAEQTRETADNINNTASQSIEHAEVSSELLNNILPKIKRTIELVREITTASIEQNSGAEQINSAINDLNKVTQENAANAEEIAANSQELASTAEKMNNLISFFKI